MPTLRRSKDHSIWFKHIDGPNDALLTQLRALEPGQTVVLKIGEDQGEWRRYRAGNDGRRPEALMCNDGRAKEIWATLVVGEPIEISFVEAGDIDDEARRLGQPKSKKRSPKKNSSNSESKGRLEFDKAGPEESEAIVDGIVANNEKVVLGGDFGAPKSAGEQAKKIIVIEAIRLGKRRYAIKPIGRNERLVRAVGNQKNWKRRRRGWTLPELQKSLSEDSSVLTVGFDFPFSIPMTLLNDAGFAQRLGQPPFLVRNRWVDFVASRLRLEFANDLAKAELEDLAQFDNWRDKECFWKYRATDRATGGQPPLKHAYQSLFAMTLTGACLLKHLAAKGYTTVLDIKQAVTRPAVFETYPAEVSERIGFIGSYKNEPKACLQKAMEYLENRGIELKFNEDVRDFCETYRTGDNDPDGADAFLCLVASICLREGMAEMCTGGAGPKIRLEEGVIIVPSAIN